MRRLVAGMAVLALAAAGAGCGSSGGGDAPTTADGVAQVKVGVIPIVDVAPIYLGQQKGFFKSRNIELTMESGQGGAAIVPGVVSGQFQFGFSNVTSLLIAQTKNVPIKVVANGVASTGEAGKDFGGVVVRKDSPITKAADLAGKKIAVNTLKNIGDTTVRESVRKAGGDPSAISFVEMPFPNMPAAVEGGQVEAAWVVEPSLSAVTAAGGRVVAWNYVDAAPDLTVAAYFASSKLIGENPDLVKRFTEAMNESLAYADAHPDEVRAVLGSYTKIDAKVREGLTLPKWPTAINKPSVETLAKLGATDGIFGGATPDLAKILP
ncbi:ABC transporter substrate-binding protein [Actinoplanes friuliensis]|jgi:NitT/TauT family transport system substrate-binding protein|uniref:Putative ABC transporter substrate-binding protein n=1 Tax=Actinoplanes friuliensis DSM 7358 TaxID=1246995 RepID=U5VZE0_9ACTN|nr:ABC transporter substrate-binding protein [Actinoplanes friuliensis]AGZ42132.1 putative ABC transporter substrate-binding protein [Actinoplanes friuliensis DSM 7358]